MFQKDRILREYPRARHFEEAHGHRTDAEGSWWRLAQRSNLTELTDIDFRPQDKMLCSAFLERWHPETNSFHLPDFGEMTITLHDIVEIVGVPIVGHEVRSPFTTRQAYERVQEIFGLETLAEVQSLAKSKLDKHFDKYL